MFSLILIGATPSSLETLFDDVISSGLKFCINCFKLFEAVVFQGIETLYASLYKFFLF